VEMPASIQKQPPLETAQPAMAIAEPEPVKPAIPAPPPIPSGPQVGDKVGFIQLPSKPVSRTGDKLGFVKLPPSRSGTGGERPDISRGGRGGDGRNLRGGLPPSRQQSPAGGGARPGFAPRPEAPKPAIPAAPKFVAPENGEIISLKPPIVVRELAEQLKRKPFQLIADLMELGVFANVNQSIEEEIARKICAKYGFRFEAEKREIGEFAWCQACELARTAGDSLVEWGSRNDGAGRGRPHYGVLFCG